MHERSSIACQCYSNLHVCFPPAGTETQGELQRQDWHTAPRDFLHNTSDREREVFAKTHVKCNALNMH